MNRGTGCGKPARPDLRGRGEVTTLSTLKLNNNGLKNCKILRVYRTSMPSLR